MRNRGFIIIGGLLILWGGLILISDLLGIDFSMICWPIALILVGIYLLVRPRMVIGKSHVTFSPLNNTRRSGPWQAASEEIYTLVGDTRLDLTQAELPQGETVLRVFGFVGDIKLYVPADLEFAVSSWAFLNDAHILGQKSERFISPVEYSSAGYANALQKFRLETYFFVADLDIYQA